MKKLLIFCVLALNVFCAQGMDYGLDGDGDLDEAIRESLAGRGVDAALAREVNLNRNQDEDPRLREALELSRALEAVEQLDAKERRDGKNQEVRALRGGQDQEYEEALVEDAELFKRWAAEANPSPKEKEREKVILSQVIRLMMTEDTNVDSIFSFLNDVDVTTIVDMVNGFNLLHYAIFYNRCDFLKVLLETYGQDKRFIAHRNIDSQTPYQYFIALNSEKIEGAEAGLIQIYISMKDLLEQHKADIVSEVGGGEPMYDKEKGEKYVIGDRVPLGGEAIASADGVGDEGADEDDDFVEEDEGDEDDGVPEGPQQEQIKNLIRCVKSRSLIALGINLRNFDIKTIVNNAGDNLLHVVARQENNGAMLQELSNRYRRNNAYSMAMKVANKAGETPEGLLQAAQPRIDREREDRGGDVAAERAVVGDELDPSRGADGEGEDKEADAAAAARLAREKTEALWSSVIDDDKFDEFQRNLNGFDIETIRREADGDNLLHVIALFGRDAMLRYVRGKFNQDVFFRAIMHKDKEGYTPKDMCDFIQDRGLIPAMKALFEEIEQDAARLGEQLLPDDGIEGEQDDRADDRDPVGGADGEVDPIEAVGDLGDYMRFILDDIAREQSNRAGDRGLEGQRPDNEGVAGRIRLDPRLLSFEEVQDAAGIAEQDQEVGREIARRREAARREAAGRQEGLDDNVRAGGAGSNPRRPMLEQSSSGATIGCIAVAAMVGFVYSVYKFLPTYFPTLLPTLRTKVRTCFGFDDKKVENNQQQQKKKVKKVRFAV